MIRRRHPLAHLPGLARYALAGTPLELKFSYSEELARKIADLASRTNFDVVQIEKERMALYIECLPSKNRYKSIIMFENFDAQQFDRIYKIERRVDRKFRSWLYSRMIRSWEPHYAGRFDRCTTVSELDKNLFQAENPSLKIEVIPNGVDTKHYQPLPRFSTKPSLLFIGNMGYLPCVDAVLFFCKEVLPLILSSIPDVELFVVGNNPPPEIVELGSSNIHITGRVEEIIPYYQTCDVCVVPLRAGGGTRLKILEAMALGRPVVATSLGCEGLDVINGTHILIGDDPKQFAKLTIQLLTDSKKYTLIAENARRLVENKYDWDLIARKMELLYE